MGLFTAVKTRGNSAGGIGRPAGGTWPGLMVCARTLEVVPNPSRGVVRPKCPLHEKTDCVARFWNGALLDKRTEGRLIRGAKPRRAVTVRYQRTAAARWIRRRRRQVRKLRSSKRAQHAAAWWATTRAKASTATTKRVRTARTAARARVGDPLVARAAAAWAALRAHVAAWLAQVRQAVADTAARRRTRP